MRRRNPLGIIITGYGASGFAGPRRVARRGYRGLGNPGYFYGLGAELPPLYRSDDLAPSTAEIEAARREEMAKLAIEVELASARDPIREATTNLRSLDQQIAAERAAQAVVNERGEALYPEQPALLAAAQPSRELQNAAQAEREIYAEALARTRMPTTTVTAAPTNELRPPTTDDSAAWMEFERKLAARAGAVPPGETGMPPAAASEMSTERGPLPSTAPPAAQAAAAAQGVALPGYNTNYIAPPLSPSPQAPAASGAGSALLLGGAALALFLLLR